MTSILFAMRDSARLDLEAIQTLKHKLDLKEVQLQRQEERLERLTKQIQDLKQTIIQSGHSNILINRNSTNERILT
jgi:phage shock protein A